MDNRKNYNGHFYALLLLLLWLPIPLGSNRPWAWSIAEIYSFALLLSWIWFHGASYDFNRLRPYAPLLFGIGMVQVWLFIQQLPIPLSLLEMIAPEKAHIFSTAGASSGSLSLDPAQTFVELVKGCCYLILLFLTLVLTTSETRLRQLAMVMVLAGVFQALYGEFLVLTKIDHLFFENPRWVGIATGSFMYRNHFANFLLLTLSTGIGLLVANLASRKTSNARSRALLWVNTLLSGKAILRIALVLMVIALVMSRSRMGNTAFFASLTICSLFALMFMKHKTRSIAWLFGSLLVIDIMIVSGWFGLEKVQERLEATSLEQETRDEVVSFGLELVKQRPITGSGAGSFYSSFQSVQGPGIKSFYDFAHNEYLQFSVEYGLFATFILGYLVLLSLWHAQYALRYRHSNLMRGMAFASMMAIIGNLIHMSVDFTLQIPANAIYFIILLAIGWMSRFNKLHRKRQTLPTSH